MSKLTETVFAEIYERDGILDPEKIHDEVAEPEHPLHNRYEWDDGVAGRKFRLAQISNDIRAVSYKFVASNDEDARVPVYLSVKRAQDPNHTSGYLLAAPIMSNPLQAKIALRQFKRELASMQRRFGWLEEYAALMQAAAVAEAS